MADWPRKWEDFVVLLLGVLLLGEIPSFVGGRVDIRKLHYNYNQVHGNDSFSRSR